MNKKFEVLKIERDRQTICVTVRGLSTDRKIEYLLAANAFYFSDEELKAEFEANPKKAAELYDAQIDLI